MRTHGMTSLVAAAGRVVDRRWRYAVLAVLLVACSEATAVPDPSDFVGLWQVVSVNGQNLPAFTNSGQTFFGGFLTLAPGGGASAEEHCAGGDTRQVVFNRLAWSPRTSTIITLTYPDRAGAPVDTAKLQGGNLHWHARGAEDQLGMSQWILTRLSTDPTDARPSACGTQ